MKPHLPESERVETDIAPADRSAMQEAFTAERALYVAELNERDIRIAKLETALAALASECARLARALDTAHSINAEAHTGRDRKVLKLETELAELEALVTKLEVRVIQGEIDRSRTGGPPAPVLDKSVN
jgi:hypothetical protein